ncbi:MAG TPA: asparaginase [Gemmatimonadales bacterium]|nr:asparaginase [Gemmatimonadales bacterium]
MTSTVESIRGRTVESRHAVSAAVVDADGTLVAGTGNPDLVTYWRSCAKPIQVLPLLTDGAADALGIDDAEIAVACASHNGEPRHVAVVEGLLRKAGCTESDLACGPHPSLSPAVARAMAERGEKPRRIHSNCSGKHAGMLAMARHHGWPTADYRHAGHAVQRRVHEEVLLWTGVPESGLHTGTDGCGVVSFALPLRNMALAYARLGARVDPAGAAQLGVKGVKGVGSANPYTPHPTPYTRSSAADRVIRAIFSDPFLVAGTGRLCTEVAAGSGGRVLAKIGAGGVYCALIPEARLGLALKVEDGDDESARVALVALLDALVPGVVRVPDAFRSPAHKNTLGEEVVHVVARISLERAVH